MKKNRLFVFLSLFPVITSARADSMPHCDVCKALIERANIICPYDTCYDETYIDALNRAVDYLPYYQTSAARTLIEEYQYIFLDRYYAYKSAADTCYEAALCCKECSGCYDLAWTAGTYTGYEHSVDYYCDCDGKCIMGNVSYRCAAGYYGASTNGYTGCTRCPSSGGVYGTSTAGSTSITSCFLPSGTSFSDDSGSGTYTNNCYFSN